MKVKLVGFRKVDYVSKKTGKDVHAYELYTEREAPSVTGIEAKSYFVGDSFLQSYIPVPGDIINIDFNQFGSIDSVELVKVVK